MVPLKEYKKKRVFINTPEPRGGKSHKNKSIFVIQKHAASHLHYDLRLEVNRVLKSWAVPKEPNNSPENKRLAMMVENHPYDYKDFEGIIPPGNYGAGTVMVWDKGTYQTMGTKDKKESEKAAIAGIENGKFTFILSGEKLKGEFALVKLRKGAKNSWLLIKANDEFANKEIVNPDTSVNSGRDMEEIRNNSPTKESSLENELNKIPLVKMPKLFSPMKAKLAEGPFNEENWIFEIKFDGYRALAFVKNNDPILYSRNGKIFNDQFSPIIDSLKKIKREMILDGEIVAISDNGKMDFQMLQNYLTERKGHLIYYVFDLPYLDGHNLTKLPLMERKKILQNILPDINNVIYTDHINKNGIEFFNLVKSKGLEGIIGKNKKSAYEIGKRSPEWLKIKAINQQEAVVAGYTEPRGGRKYFGALVLGVYNNGNLTYTGHVGTGFSDKLLEELYNKLTKIKSKQSYFPVPPKTNMPVQWVKPQIVCEVSFFEWTKEGVMRHPSFLGLRDDKNPKEIKKEIPKNSNPKSQNNIYKFSPKYSKLKFTNLDKIYWPKEGYIKKDLIEYYDKISEFILPYLKDRPESLNRHPNGINGDSFFQKNIENQVPDWVKTKGIYSESEEKTINYLLCQNKETLLYMANLGCIEINPWNSRIRKLDFPDFLVLDIDPGDNPFSEVVKVAQTTKKLLDKLEIPSFCKTSGSTGLHIYIPLRAKYHYDQVREFAKLLEIFVHKDIPKITSLERNPRNRKKLIYLDFLQNRIGQTMAAPYSLRPKSGAPVSTPLKWGEVNNSLDPLKFNIKTIFKRLDKVGDLWKGIMGKGIDMERILDNLKSDQ